MVPVHVVTGFLGAGKTSLLLAQLAARQDDERCAVIVNDFGEARFDATLLGGVARVMDIPGGCVCCTAPQDLAPTLRALLSGGDLDRVFIEATGLARPADIVDTLRRAFPGGSIEVAPVVAVVDARRWAARDEPLLDEQLEAADVVVVNRGAAAPSAARALTAWADARHPPLLAVHLSERPEDVPQTAFDARPSEPRPFLPHDHHAHASTEGWSAASRIWDAARVFDMGALRRILGEAGAERVKGVFHTDIGWYRVEVAGGELDRSPTPFHSSSRVDVILRGSAAEAAALIDALDRAEWAPPPEGSVPEVRLTTASGETILLGRAALLELEGQVADVAAHVPGREGAGVWLRAVLAMAHPPEGARFSVAAHDGMTTAPVAVADVGEAILVHSLEGEPYPGKQGGPFRIFIPEGEGRSACANVKKVARLVIEGA